MDMMNKKIFISHRSTDKEIADMLLDYFASTGLSTDSVFCSSLPGNDVKNKISEEIKQTIKCSAINIIIMSNEYYQSAYCLNEEGIIWFIDSPIIVIAMPEIQPSNMVGFIRDEYKLRRLDNESDIAAIYDHIANLFPTDKKSISSITHQIKKIKGRYLDYLNGKTKEENICIESLNGFDDITTDDEKVILYYLISQKIRKVQDVDIKNWLTENEIYGINVANALDLLAVSGWGTLKLGGANVSCVIIGLSNSQENSSKLLINNGFIYQAKKISPYLTANSEIIIRKRTTPLSKLPQMSYGNMPLEGGFLKLSKDEKDSLVRNDNRSLKFIRRVIGGDEFLSGYERYCLWIDDNELEEATQIDEIRTRIEKVYKFRISGGDVAKTLVEKSHQFRYRKEAKTNLVLIPCTSSEKREYLQCGFFDKSYITLNSAQIIYDTSPYIFGVLSSRLIQIIGRCTRDSINKTHAQFTNLIAQPDATDELVKLSVNNMLKAITASLLMEQVLAPSFKFKSRVDDNEKGKTGEIRIWGFKEPSSKRVKEIIESDLNDLKASILQDDKMIKATPGNVDPQVINKVLIPKIIQVKYPELSEQEVEELRQYVVVDSVLKNGEIKETGDKRFVRMAGQFVNIDDLHIDLIDSINPFQKAFEILSKSVTTHVLKVIQETIEATRIQMSEEEAIILWPKINYFIRTRNAQPSIYSSDPLEKRLAEAIIFLKEQKRKMTQNG